MKKNKKKKEIIDIPLQTYNFLIENEKEKEKNMIKEQEPKKFISKRVLDKKKSLGINTMEQTIEKTIRLFNPRYLPFNCVKKNI